MKRYILLVFLLFVMLFMVACGSPDQTSPTASPIPATMTAVPTLVPTLTPTLDPLNPHEGAPPYWSLLGGADATAGLKGTVGAEYFPNAGTDIIFSYPAGLNPLCEPDNREDNGDPFPCPWVFPVPNTTGLFTFEAGERAGYFGYTYDPVIALYPSDNYRYLVRCDIAQGTPRFSDNSFGIMARFLGDGFPDNVYTFPRQRTGAPNDSYVWVFEVSQQIEITFQCGIDVDYGTFAGLNFTYSYIDIQIVGANYGEDNYITLP